MPVKRKLKPARTNAAQKIQPLFSSTQGKESLDIRPFLDLSNEAYIAINDLGQILYTNQSFRTITGYSEKDLETLHFMEIFSREDRPYIRAGVQAFDTESKTKQNPVTDFEARIITKTAKPARWNGANSYAEIYSIAPDGISHQSGRKKRN